MMVALRNALVGNKKQESGYWGLCFTAEEASSTVKLGPRLGTPPAANFAISYDAQTWEDYTEKTVITLQNVGDKVYFAARGNTVNTQMTSGVRASRAFTITGKVAASGNIMSLVKNDLTWNEVQIGVRCFSGLFYGCAITTAPDLPVTNISQYCYHQLFYNCSQLTTATSVLPATVPQNNCYQQMFYGCSSLVKAPEIMLTRNDVQGCMTEMFIYCPALNEIKVHFTEWNIVNGASTTRSWIDSTLEGTFYCPSALGTNETITRGFSTCPATFTVVNI